MRKITKFFVIFLFLFIANSAFGFDFRDNILFHIKKKEIVKPKMVETKEEWEVEAQNIPLSERKIEIEKPKVDPKKYYIPETRYVFAKYNYPQGSRELNFEDVKKNLYTYPYLVADKECHYVAYSRYYFSPDLNQISSNFYVEKLDTSKNKTRRILEYNHNQLQRNPIIEAGTKENYPNLFQGLTLVDWSADGKKLLIKEKIGSTQNGVYKTYLYVHFLETEITNAYTIKMVNFDEAIKNYFLDWENKQIVKYRYDIVPLGFDSNDDDIVISLCYVYDKDNKKIFLGTWGYNVKTYKTILYSKDDLSPSISINGLILKQKIF